MKVAYFINQYPKVSHSFIRREILALEKQGIEVLRLALRGWSEKLVDPQDVAEQSQTFYVLRQGAVGLLRALLAQLIRTPVAFVQAVLLAWRMSRGSGRSLPYHFVYLAEACQILGHLRHHPVQHVHAHFGTNSTEIVMLARALGGPPYSFTVHGPEEFDQPAALHIPAKIQSAAFVVAISSFGRSQLYRWVPYEQWKRIHVVHCGLEKSFYEGAESSPVADTPRLVCVGRLCEQKGQLILMEALQLLKRQGVAFELVLAGDGEMRPEIEQMVARHDMQQNVRITGWISSDQVREELQAARVMVLPSFAEGLPVVIMEAMALERPVVTTSIAGIPELVRHGLDGWLVAAGDVEALAGALIEALRTDVAELQNMGRQGRQRVNLRHDIDTEASKLAKLFRGQA
jgi:colanic acid/amylovoran biosynthesis glycosyltransferase